jgi:3-oxoacyl-[acyl-carrier protein] reductase
MKLDLNGRKILVTGGARGIGEAISRDLIRAGAQVAVHYQNSGKSAIDIASTGNGSFSLQADLNNTEQIAGMFRIALEKLGSLDVLVNNAGIALNSSPALDDSTWLNDWDRTLNTNLKSCAYLCKLALPVFIQNGSGIIINISSRAAHRGDTRDYLAYAASKGGMESLTKSLARAYGKQGVLVYGIAPGFTRTDMAADFISAYGENYALDDIALTDLTRPQDISPTVVFLSTGMARHATGTTIDINAASYVR